MLRVRGLFTVHPIGYLPGQVPAVFKGNGSGCLPAASTDNGLTVTKSKASFACHYYQDSHTGSTCVT